MKSLPALFVAMLLVCAVAACHPKKAAGQMAPDAVGQWQWSNDLLGSWQLDLQADGTFQRVINSPLDEKPVIHGGRWVVSLDPPSHGLIQNDAVTDDLLRAAGVDEKDRTIQWSAPGTLAFFYTVPKGAHLQDGAAWNGITHAESDTPGAPVVQEIEERHPVRTHTNTATHEIFLDLNGKVFRTRPGKIQTEAPTTPPPVTGEPDYSTVTPIAGIRLDLPSIWQAVGVDAANTQPAVPVTTLSRPPETRPSGGWRFHPPGAAEEAYIVLAIQASTLSREEMADTSEINLDRFAAGFVKGATRALMGKDFLLAPEVKAERTTIGLQNGVLCTTSMSDPEGNRMAIRAYAIPMESATIVLVCCWSTEPGKPWKPIMDHVAASLRITGK